jgi:predicted ATPase
MLNINNFRSAHSKLLNYDPSYFYNHQNSFLEFLYSIEVVDFRHIKDLKVNFQHPVTVISGTNKVGKTSLLLLIACSHVNFLKYDSTKPETKLRKHEWRDVISFTNSETVNNNYVYRLQWRKGNEDRSGEGKRKASSKAWSGLAKYSSDKRRKNAKIREKEVRLIDLERVLPVRNFSDSLLRKIREPHEGNRLNRDVEQAFAYIFELTQNIQIFNIGSHINKVAYLIYSPNGDAYSSYNAATGEEALLNILQDIFDANNDSLILIDEIEAGLHPSIQRKLAEVVEYVSWNHKKQFIITTHSPTLMSAFNKKSRVFIDTKLDGTFEAIPKISKNAAFSRMDTGLHPLVNLYCEDNEAEFIINSLLTELNKSHKNFHKLVNVIKSGPINQVKNDYEMHKRIYPQLRIKTGYACVFDGDYVDNSDYSFYHENQNEFSFFLYPYMAPEKFLVNAYLNQNPNDRLQSALNFSDHHTLFQEMTNFGLAADRNQARNHCWDIFKQTSDYTKLERTFNIFIKRTVKYFSESSD